MKIIPFRGVCGHTDKRIFRFRSALRVLMHRRRVSGRVVQLISGHLSFGAVALRRALSLLDSVYKCAAKHWMSRGIPWESEFQAYAGLFSLLKRDWTDCWCPKVYCSDARRRKMSFLKRTWRRSQIFPRCVLRCLLWTPGVLSIMDDLCGARIFRYSRLCTIQLFCQHITVSLDFADQRCTAESPVSRVPQICVSFLEHQSGATEPPFSCVDQDSVSST